VSINVPLNLVSQLAIKKHYLSLQSSLFQSTFQRETLFQSSKYKPRVKLDFRKLWRRLLCHIAIYDIFIKKNKEEKLVGTTSIILVLSHGSH
jgi:hypothetical protein